MSYFFHYKFWSGVHLTNSSLQFKKNALLIYLRGKTLLPVSSAFPNYLPLFHTLVVFSEDLSGIYSP